MADGLVYGSLPDFQYGSRVEPGKSFRNGNEALGRETGTDLSTKDAEQDFIRN